MRDLGQQQQQQQSQGDKKPVPIDLLPVPLLIPPPYPNSLANFFGNLFADYLPSSQAYSSKNQWSSFFNIVLQNHQALTKLNRTRHETSQKGWVKKTPSFQSKLSNQQATAYIIRYVRPFYFWKSFSSDAKIALSPFSSHTGTGIMKLPSLRLFLKMCIFIITKGSMKGEDRKWSRPPFYPERIIWDKPFDIQWKRYCTNPHPFHSQDFSWYFNWIFCEISILLPFLFHDFFQDISMRFSCEISKVPLGLISLLLPFPFVRSEAPAVPSLIYCIIDVPVMTTMIRTRRRVIEKKT